MDVTEILVLSIGLAMDSMAVSVTLGAQEDLKREHKLFTTAVLCGLFFGGFQALMPALGWLLGSGARQFVSGIDHWIAFFLLTIIGLRMIWEAVAGKQESAESRAMPTSIQMFILLAFATSIDAFAAGVSLAFIDAPIVVAIASIGAITFALSFIGAYVGDRFGPALGSKFDAVGGIALIAIGIRILLSHLGII